MNAGLGLMINFTKKSQQWAVFMLGGGGVYVSTFKRLTYSESNINLG